MSTTSGRPAATRGLLRATLTLVAGGALAQALPLLLGPWLTRLYGPAQFGRYHLFAAVAANIGVVACARYEFALPMLRDDHEADVLRRLCLALGAAVAVAAALGGIAWWAWSGQGWALWLGPAVAALGLLSLATLWATRAQRFHALAVARVVQYGGGAAGQAVLGLLGAGVQGLVAAPIAAAAAATAMLRLPLGRRAVGAHAVAGVEGDRDADPDAHAAARAWLPAGWRALAHRLRDFPLLNTPHAFAGALQDTVALALVAAWQGPVAAGFWGLSLRYLKAPSTLVGGAVSQALYPKLAAEEGAHGETGAVVTAEARAAVRRVMGVLAALALPLVVVLVAFGPWLFARAFGAQWRGAGELARALAPYIGAHFVAAPLAVVTLSWEAQAWALRLAIVGQVAYVAALAGGLALGGLQGAGWAVSAAMVLYFGYYFLRLATWRLGAVQVPGEAPPLAAAHDAGTPGGTA